MDKKKRIIIGFFAVIGILVAMTLVNQTKQNAPDDKGEKLTGKLQLKKEKSSSQPSNSQKEQTSFDSASQETAPDTEQSQTEPTLSVWDGSGADNQWSTPENWQEDKIPQPGDDLLFPQSSFHLHNIYLPTPTAFKSMTLSGSDYVITEPSDSYDNDLMLGPGGIVATNESGGNRLDVDMVISQLTTITVSTAESTLEINSNIKGSGSLKKEGEGTLIFTENTLHTYTGNTTVTAGTVVVNGQQRTSPIILTAGTLAGNGTTSTIQGTGGTITPGKPLQSGLLTTDAIELKNPTIISLDLNDLTEYDRFNVTGTVSLEKPRLEVKLGGGFKPALNTTFIIIKNDGFDSILGIFENLPEGSFFTINETKFTISYVGGDGNDVVLSVN